MTIHEYSARSIDGVTVPLATFRGKVCLIVNIASECGYTPQLEALEGLYRKHRDRDFTVLGFPCDQFGHQEPGDEPSIKAFCSRTYGVSFPLFSKIEVNGSGAHPLYDFLTSRRRGLLGTRRIKWNFTKFLVGRDGVPQRRFGPRMRPEQIEPAVADLL